MDESMLLEILGEIDSMTPDEYRKFFSESQSLPDCLPNLESIPPASVTEPPSMPASVA